MVKLSLKGAQDPADSSLQMKVLHEFILRQGSILSLDANYPPNRSPVPKYMLSDSSLPTKSSPSPNSGITCVVS